MKTVKTKLILSIVMLSLALIAQSTVVRFETNFGNIDIEMKESAAPMNVQNFLNYVNDGDYDNSIIHRSVPGFVIQGGALYSNGNALVEIPENNAVVNEFHLSNVRGTISMAKLENQPNSATNNFFFNVRNNSANLDNQNGGFTVFGEVIAGMNIIDLIASLYTASSVPLYDYKPFDPVELDNYVYINKVIMAWFTYDTTVPDDLTPSEVSYAGGRWLTAVGNFQGNVFTGTIYETSGGLFENGAPITNTPVGTVTLTFNSCSQVVMNYSIYGATLNGMNNLQRISGANVAMCEQMANEANQGD